MTQPSEDKATLACKPDWERAKRRWEAFWDLAPTDRPCMDVRAPSGARPDPPSPVQHLEQLYLDPEHVAARWEHALAGTYFGGEAVPTGGFLMGGYAIGCGPGVQFADNTVWHPVTMDSLDRSVEWHPGPNDPWTRKLEAVLRRLLDIAPGRFLVGYAMQVPCNDLLALLRGVDDFLIDLAQDMPKCRARLEETFELWVATFEYLRGVVDERQHEGCVWGWPGLWHPDFIKVTQSDISCMISGEMFEQYVMHEMDMLAERYGLLWYHLDGPDAVRHAPALLGRPYLRALQYVPGAGQPPNGPHWMDLYRLVQKRGRCLDISVPREHVEYVVRRLRPEGLVVRTSAAGHEQADELVEQTAQWAGTHAGSES